MEGKNNRRYNNNNFNTYNSSNNINNYDSDEVKEAMEKLKEERKKNTKLKKENLELYSNILSLKSTAKEKINPIPPSRENNFPKFEDLKKKINLFTNIETLKFFNKNLKDQNLNNDGFKFFFHTLIYLNEFVLNPLPDCSFHRLAYIFHLDMEYEVKEVDPQ
jgi:predicted  nucleic acid-binding Zn-ribbon protein